MRVVFVCLSLECALLFWLNLSLDSNHVCLCETCISLCMCVSVCVTSICHCTIFQHHGCLRFIRFCPPSKTCSLLCCHPHHIFFSVIVSLSVIASLSESLLFILTLQSQPYYCTVLPKYYMSVIPTRLCYAFATCSTHICTHYLHPQLYST